MAQKTQMKILTAEDIWAAKDIEERTVPVPQWNGAVRIRTFSKRQATELTRKAQRRNRLGQMETDDELLEALFFVEGIVEPKLAIEDYERLQEKSAAAVAIILKAIMDASGLSAEAMTDARKSPENGHDPEV